MRRLLDPRPICWSDCYECGAQSEPNALGNVVGKRKLFLWCFHFQDYLVLAQTKETSKKATSIQAKEPQSEQAAALGSGRSHDRARIVGHGQGARGNVSANTGIGAHQEGRDGIGCRQQWRTTRIEHFVQEIGNRLYVVRDHTQRCRCGAHLTNEKVILRLGNVHELVHTIHIGVTGIGGKARRIAAKNGPKELVQVCKERRGRGRTVEKVDGHGLVAAIGCGLGAIEKPSQTAFRGQKARYFERGIACTSQVNECHEQGKLVGTGIVLEECNRVLGAQRLGRRNSSGHRRRQYEKGNGNLHCENYCWPGSFHFENENKQRQRK
jgi:hypothetical protein